MIMAKMTERETLVDIMIFFPTIEQLYLEDHLTEFTFQTFPEFASALQYIIF